MLIHSEIHLRDFQFWSGGADNANCLSYEQLDIIEEILSDIYPDGIAETMLNDLMWIDCDIIAELFWFDEDIIAEWLNYADFEELKEESVPWN